MSINYLDNKIEEKNITRLLNKLEISDDIVEEINSILSIENLDEVFSLIEKYIENWRIIYKKYWDDIENKEKIIGFILKNISRLLNDLNIKRAHNSSSCSMINSLEELSYREQLKKILFIKSEPISKQNVVWWSCNNWVIFFHKLMNDITDFDEDIKYNFQINTKNNHWIIYLNIWKNKYIFEDTPRWFLLEHRKKWDFKVKDKNKPEFFESVAEYKENVLEWLQNRDDLTYHIWNDRLKLKIRFWLLIISYKNKQSRYIKINWLKRISKKIAEIGITKYVWKRPRFNNLSDIKMFITSKIKDKERAEEILNNFEDKKLLDFFN